MTIAKESSHRERIARFLEGTGYQIPTNPPGRDLTWYKGGESEPVELPAPDRSLAKVTIYGLIVSVPCWLLIFWWLFR